MIEPEVKGISSTDWSPNTVWDDGPICVWFHVEIGPAGSDAADLFQVGVCNERWFYSDARHKDANVVADEAIFLKPYVLFMKEFSFEIMRSILTKIIIHYGLYEDWISFSKIMSNILMWEGEGLELP